MRIPALLPTDEVTIDKLLNLSKLLVYSYDIGENSTRVVKKERKKIRQVHNIVPGRLIDQ